jgi:hypothetical protein
MECLPLKNIIVNHRRVKFGPSQELGGGDAVLFFKLVKYRLNLDKGEDLFTDGHTASK